MVVLGQQWEDMGCHGITQQVFYGGGVFLELCLWITLGIAGLTGGAGRPIPGVCQTMAEASAFEESPGTTGTRAR
jgi:hypothetical protein